MKAAPLTRAPSTEDLLAALLRPLAWPFPAEAVKLRQTHISYLFFVGQRVYKVKKPVRLPFLDFSTLERRRHFCEEEVALNRRLAPDVYLGVVPVTRAPSGALAVGGRGEPLEWAVAMRRLPEERMLDRLLLRGEIDNEPLSALAEKLAAFHAAAATGPGVDEHGSPEAVREIVLGNLEELADFAGDLLRSPRPAVLTPATLRFLARGQERFLDANRRLLEGRVRRGRIRDGHGDLHAGNVCLTEKGPVLYDALEFDPALRCGDVAADLAFLAMDLDQRGFRAHARWLVESYANLAGDHGVAWLIDFYKTHRALVRAKVCGLRAGQEGRDPEAAAADVAAAQGYAALAASYALPAALVVLCGLPASGKSTLARGLGSTLDALVLRSDVERKRLLGLPPASHPPADLRAQLYSAASTEATYARLLRLALDGLRRRRSVVLDATFSERTRRRRVVDVATRLGFPVVVVHVSCPPERARERLVARRSLAAEVSDADLAVYERAAEIFEPPDDLAAEQLVEAPTTRPPATVAAALVDRIVRQREPAAAAARRPLPKEA